MDLSADREANIINAGRTGLKCIPERAALPPDDFRRVDYLKSQSNF